VRKRGNRAVKKPQDARYMVNASIEVWMALTVLHEMVLFSPLHPLSIINRFINRRWGETSIVLADDFFDLIGGEFNW